MIGFRTSNEYVYVLTTFVLNFRVQQQKKRPRISQRRVQSKDLSKVKKRDVAQARADEFFLWKFKIVISNLARLWCLQKNVHVEAPQELQNSWLLSELIPSSDQWEKFGVHWLVNRKLCYLIKTAQFDGPRLPTQGTNPKSNDTPIRPTRDLVCHQPCFVPLSFSLPSMSKIGEPNCHSFIKWCNLVNMNSLFTLCW